MVDQALARQLDAVWGEADQWVAEGQHWTHLPAVRDAIHRRVTGHESVDVLTWFFDRVAAWKPMPLGRVLVLGCGTAGQERMLADRGWTREVVACDLSGQAVATAQAAAQGLPNVTVVQADMNDLPVGRSPFGEGAFDAVLGLSSVHHCADLANLYDALHRLLVPGGWLFLNEYVGPDRFQYPDSQMRLAARLGATLGQRLMTTARGHAKQGCLKPPVSDVVRVDPTEAVCSSQILPLLAPRFEVVAHRPFGGALLNVVLGAVAQNFMAEDTRHLADLLVAVEDELYSQHLLPHDFACVIARARR